MTLPLYAYAAAGGLLVLAAVYAIGRRHARQRAKSEGLQDYAETRKKADEADIVDSPDLARSWLHERGKR